MHTAIVILNWNTEDYLRRFLPGLIESVKGEDAEIIVADNASSDNSIKVMAEYFPDIRTIRLDKNYGFTGGYNKALAQIEADYYVLINTDIEVPAGWLGPLLETMDRNPDIGACAPKLHSMQDRNMFEYAGAAGGYIDRFGFPFCRGRILQMVEKDEGQYDEPLDTLWVSGACLMVRSTVYNMLGGLDDRFFAHMEEIDLCWRMQLAGYKVRIVPQSVVWHIGGGTLPASSPWKLKLNYRNNLLMLQNNLAKTYAARLQSGRDEIADRQKIHAMAKKACRKARSLIFKRMLIDGCAAMAYLLKFNMASFKAVIEAHNEFKESGIRPDINGIETYLKSCGDIKVHGIYSKSIIFQAFIHGRKIFRNIDWNNL